jgi:hypothetical protein
VTAAAHARACEGRRAFKRAEAEEILAGRLTIRPFATVTIDPGRDGDIDWSQDPFRHPSWSVTFRSGKWIGPLIEGHLAGGRQAGAYRDRAAALLRGWLRAVPIQERAPETLVCAARAFPGARWIENQIPRHVDHYAAHWQGPWNHGLQQDLELLRIGCAYPPGAWDERPRQWRTLAVRHMIKAFGANPLGPAVDRQGASNEQSTAYTKFAYDWWKMAEQRVADCGDRLPDEMSARIARMPTFLAHATQPDGKLVQLGDSYVTRPQDVPGTPLRYVATRGAAGSPPAQRVAVYSAGYVFGRSGWGTARPFAAESFYSLRFGRGRQVHGHQDHMSLTYYARGRNLIVDGGHTGYEETPYRAYLRSPEAHNVLVLPGVRFSGTARTNVTRRVAGRNGEFFALTDTAYGGRRRDRGVYFAQRPDLILVFDRAAGGAGYQSYRQLWHLDPGLEVTTVRDTHVVAAAPGARLEVRRIPLPGRPIPPASTKVIRGRTDPYQGWVSRAMLERTPAPVISMTDTGSSVAMLTLIAPSAPGAAVSATRTERSPGQYLVTVRIGRESRSFLVRPDGEISEA